MITRARLQFLRSLRQKKVRAEEGVLLLEGVNAAEAAVEGGFARELLLGAAASEMPRVRRLCGLCGTRVAIQRIEAREIESLAETESPSGVFALAESPVLPFRAGEFPAEAIVLVAAGVADPGNLGTLIRAAAALGASAVLTTGGTVDVTNPKVVRASAGAAFRLPMRTGELEAMRDDGFAVWIGDAKGEPVTALGMRPARLALVVGSEPHGVGSRAHALADRTIGIPIRPLVESLNVAVAAALLLHATTALPVAMASGPA